MRNARRRGFGVAVLLAALWLAMPAGAAADVVGFDHVHLNVPDPAAAVAWYQKYMGATPGPAPDRVLAGKTLIIMTKAASAEPSALSAVDHIGFSFADLDAKMKELDAAGAKVVNPVRDVPGLFKLAFIEDPWGVKIELVQDAETLGFHHVHLRTPDPDAALAWYLANFGGERAKLKGRNDAVKYGEVWILAQKGDAAPTAGRAIDHIGWRATNLDATAAALKGKGVTFTTDPEARNTLRVAFLEGPSGVKIELVQR